jgi:hypothetical protein
MTEMSDTIPDNLQMNQQSFILDPLTVIIKLAILSNKPIGTKLFIQNNLIYFQEPGIFQGFCRLIYKSNKTDLQFLYNPLQLACAFFLSKDTLKKTPRMKNLFICAQNGLLQLMETYKNSSIIRLALNYYYVIISNFVDEVYNDKLFKKDSMTTFYNEAIVKTLNERWTNEKIKVILDIISFLNTDTTSAINNVKSIETLMFTIDEETRTIINNSI